ncbi:MAG: DUF4173 domain-containing protein [Verrucomicrobiota bacterium]
MDSPLYPSKLPASATTDPHPQKTPQALNSQVKLRLSIFLLILAADFLTFGITLGAGVTLLCGLIWFALRINRPARPTDWKDLLLYFLMAATAIQASIESSFSNWLVIFILTIYASGHFLHRQIAPYWRRALEGLFGLFDIYLTCYHLKRIMQETAHSTRTSTFNNNLKKTRRWAKIVLPTSLLTLIFLILFSNGNAIMGDGIKNLFTTLFSWIGTFQFPSILRILFWIGSGFLLLSLLSRSPLSLDLIRLRKKLPLTWASPNDLNASIWSSRLLLIAVNVIFFSANTLDVFYLWMETALPSDVNFSEYVHQGVYNLIACVALAASVLLIIFQQDKQVTNAPGQKILAHIWIAQNFLLVSSVLLRLKLYVDTYHLSLLRLYVAFFLILVVVGFVLLAIKIHQQRKFSWLVNANLFAVFLLFFIVQGPDDHAFVARYNYQQALQADKQNHRIDIPYLTKLGPPAWPTLQLIANNQKHFGAAARQARKQILKVSRDEQKQMENKDWRSWQYRHWAALHSLPGFNRQAKQLSYASPKP